MHGKAAAGLFACALLVGPSAWAQRSSRVATAPAVKETAAARVDEYQVAAGTALLMKLRTPLDSSSSVVDDQVEGVLWSPVIQDGIELIPEGSIVFGKVVEVSPATKQRLVGSVVVTFQIVEHVTTRSRATVRTRRTIFSASPPAARRGARPKPTDAVIPAGTSFTAMTAEPLLVRIPR